MVKEAAEQNLPQDLARQDAGASNVVPADDSCIDSSIGTQLADDHIYSAALRPHSIRNERYAIC